MNQLAVLLLTAGVAVPDRPGPLEKGWYSPHVLLPLLAARDGIRWATPETLSGRACVGAMDFDLEHNVFVLFSFRDKQVWAYRHKAVEPGTRAK